MRVRFKDKQIKRLTDDIKVFDNELVIKKQTDYKPEYFDDEN